MAQKQQDPEQILRTLSDRVEKVGDLGSEIQEIQTEYDAEIRALQKQAGREVKPLETKRERAFQMIVKLVRVHWDKLVKHGKTLKLPTGTIQIKTSSQPQVTVTDEDAAVRELEKRGRHNAVHTVKRVNKRAVQSDPELAKGIRHIKVEDRADTITVTPTEGVTLKRPIGKMRQKR